MVSLLVLIIYVVVASLALSRYVRRKDSRLPPGSMGWPLIGETLSLIKAHPVTWRGAFLENRIPKFGKFFSSHLFGETMVVSADPELNRLILKNTGTMFESAYPHNFKKLMAKFVTGDAHKHMRTVMLQFLSAERLQTVFLHDAEQYASQLLAKWEEGSVISATEEANKFAFYFIVKQMLNMDFNEEPVIEKLRGEYHTLSRGLTSLPIYLPGTNYWKAFKSRTYILNFLKQKIEEHICKRNGYERSGGNDFLSYLVKNTDDTTEKISDQFLNLLLAGHHTSSQAISSMFYFLKGCPNAIEQLQVMRIKVLVTLCKKYQEEKVQIIKVKQLKGESALTWDDYRGMEFTQCVIMEILRLCHVAPILFRKSTSDFYFKGYVIPRDCSIILHTCGMHLDPTLFKDPQHFNPWRWLNPSGINKKDAFMPFGGGVKLCAGNTLARLEMIVFLHHLIMKYDWELVERDDPISSPTTVYVKGLNIKVRRL